MYQMVLLLAFVLLLTATGVLSNPVFVNIQQAPYVVSITLEDHELTCTGTIISSDSVLSAGHCFSSPNLPFLVHSGSNVWTQGKIHKVSKVIIHENFKYTDDGTPINDIAILHVNPPFTFDDTTQPAKLFNSSSQTTNGQAAVVTSWDDYHPGDHSNRLLSISLNILNKETCKTTFTPSTELSHEQICTANRADVEDMCYGNSGAPLMVNDQQAGIVSWSGPGCDKNKYPGVYTDVAYHRSWIDQHIRA